MGDRSVKVILGIEVGSYVTGMRNASKATRDLANDTLKTAQRNKAAFTDLGFAVGGFGAAAAFGVGKAVSAFASFDQGMSNVRAATHETESNMGLLGAAALKAGADTAFSATEATSAIENLAKAGVSTKDVLGGGLRGALDLAAAGELAVGDAAEIAATAMTQFNLAGRDVPHIADLLAAAAGKAQGEVGDMAMALKQSGLVASQMGLSIEETTGTLAAFASAGLLGSDAGTSFRTMLLRLANPSMEAAQVMKDMGLAAYDAQGNFAGMQSVAEQLRTKLGPMTQAQRDATLATVFGSDAIRAANVLYNQGADGIEEWTSKVNDQGYAAETAALKLDNLRGDIEKLSGSLETAFIKSGAAGDDFARGSVQNLTKVVNAYGELPASVQGATLKVGAFAAAAGIVGGGLLLLLPRIAETRAAMRTLGTEMPRTTRAAKALGKAFTAFVVLETAMSFLGSSGDDFKEFADKIDAGAGPDTQDKISKLTQEMEGLRSFSEQGWDTGNIFWNDFGQGYRDAASKADALEDRIGTLKAAQEVGAEAARHASEASFTQAEALGFVGTAADTVGQSVDDLKGAVESLSEAFSADRAEIDYQSTLDELGGSLDDLSGKEKRQARALDVTSEAGRNTRSTLLDLIEAAAAHGQEVFDETADVGKATTAFNKHRAEIERVATKLGLNKAEVAKLIAEYGRVPESIATDVNVTGLRSASAQLEDLHRRLGNLNGRHFSFTVKGVTAGTGVWAGSTGGAVWGAGTATSDSVDARLSKGEHVLTAAEVDRMGGQDAVYAFRRSLMQRFAKGGAVGFAAGGAVDADLSGAMSRYKSGLPDSITRGDYLKVLRAQRSALDDVRRAERALAAERTSKDRDRRQVADLEARLRRERRDLANATDKLQVAEFRYRATRDRPAVGFGKALALDIKATGGFISNLTKLAQRGFGPFAQQLLAMGGAEAEQIAADAVKMTGAQVGKLAGQVATSQKQQTALAGLAEVLGNGGRPVPAGSIPLSMLPGPQGPLGGGGQPKAMVNIDYADMRGLDEQQAAEKFWRMTKARG